MSEILLFHHALGQTDGFLAFADQWRQAGHTVHTPDLYHGRVFDDLDEGVGYARQAGMEKIMRDGIAVADDLPQNLVYAGFSLGNMSAQALTQNRPGARGTLLFHGAIPTAEFGNPWPPRTPLQMHVMEDDDWGDVDDCRALEKEIDEAELFLYPGSGHLFADVTTSDYDPASAQLLMQRSLDFLDRVG